MSTKNGGVLINGREVIGARRQHFDHPVLWLDEQVHAARAMRAGDPWVLACNDCAKVLVLRDGESVPACCLACGAPVCPACRAQIELRQSGCEPGLDPAPREGT